MAFDFNDIENDDSSEVSKMIDDAIIDKQNKNLSAYVMDIVKVNKMPGFSQQYDEDLQQEVFGKRIHNPNMGVVGNIKSYLINSGWTWIGYDAFRVIFCGNNNSERAKIYELLGGRLFNKLNDLYKTNKDIYILISPDKGLFAIIKFNRKVYSYLFAFGFTYNVVYDIDIDKAKSSNKDVLSIIKQINKINKQYIGKITIPSTLNFQVVDIPGCAMAICLEAPYRLDYYKLTKKVNASTPAIKVLKKFISNWRTPIKEQKDWPDYILSTCKGDIKFVCFSRIKPPYYKLDPGYIRKDDEDMKNKWQVIPDVITFIDLLPDGTLKFYITVTDNYGHDKKGLRCPKE